MKTLSILQRTSLHITKSTPPRRSNSLLHQLHNTYLQNRWRLNAGAKGFSGASSSSSSTNAQQQPKNKQIPAGKSSSSSSTNAQQQPNNKQIPAGKNYRGDNDDKIPDVIWERMIPRILFYVGVPLITGFVLLAVLGALKEQKLWDVPKWVQLLTTFVSFGSSTLGIAYGTLSTSWDEEKEGSFLGLEQAQENWNKVWEEEDANNV